MKNRDEWRWDHGWRPHEEHWPVVEALFLIFFEEAHCLSSADISKDVYSYT